MPASLFQSINPIYIILLAPMFAGLWMALGKRGLEPSAPAKFGLALLQVGFGFLVFVWGANAVGIGGDDPGAVRLPASICCTPPASCACRRSASAR